MYLVTSNVSYYTYKISHDAEAHTETLGVGSSTSIVKVKWSSAHRIDIVSTTQE